MRASDLASIVLYALIVLVAVWETILDDLGIALKPLEAEGFFVTALLMIGITLASAIFVSTGPGASRRERSGE